MIKKCVSHVDSVHLGGVALVYFTLQKPRWDKCHTLCAPLYLQQCNIEAILIAEKAVS